MTWLYVPSACVPVLPVSTSDCDSLTLPSEPSATSSGATSRQPLSPRELRTKPWMTLLSGMTLEPSTADRGVARWISSLRDFPASPSVSPASDSVWPTSDSSGEMWHGSLARWDRNESCWRTSQASFLPMADSSSDVFSAIWPTSGMTRNGTCSARRKRVPLTGGSDGSAWQFPTPDAGVRDGHNTSPGPAGARPTLARMAKEQWPTASVKGNYNRHGLSEKAGDGLATAASLWSTPTVQDGKNNGGPSQFDRNSQPLNVQSILWATPRAEHDSGKHRGHADTLHSQTKQWPTPQAHDSQAGDPARVGRFGTKHGGRNLADEALVSIHQPETITPDGKTSPKVLNPRFAEMLMGWPMGWTNPSSPIDPTAYAQWAMASCRSLQRLLGSNSMTDFADMETAS